MSFIDFITVFTGAATMIAATVAVIELKATAKQYNEDKLHDKRKDTLDAYNVLQSEVFDKLYIDYTPSKIKKIAEHYKEPEYSHDYHVLGTLLARIEHFCVGVNTEVYDWKTVYELSHGFFDKTVRYRIAPLIERKEGFFGTDPYENTKRVFEKMEAETERRENTSA